mmetsp:Transcript_7792/g.16285  ORF Transcript_7792/g.16285 Transcript_7792/m.16285 type:complete len:87 (+) Transcript_7792:1013-1273(+)
MSVCLDSFVARGDQLEEPFVPSSSVSAPLGHASGHLISEAVGLTDQEPGPINAVATGMLGGIGSCRSRDLKEAGAAHQPARGRSAL